MNSRIVLLHGFTQSGGCWNEVADALERLGYEVSAPDLPGHGPNSNDDLATPEEAARLVAEKEGPAVYVGYSLGARVAMRLAVCAPQALVGLILVGPKLGYPDEIAAGERRAADEVLAMRLEEGSVDDFIDQWLSLDFNRRVRETHLHRAVRKQNRSSGLAASLRHAGSGTIRVPADLVRCRGGVLCVVGEHDFEDVIAAAAELAAVSGNRLLTVPGVGHALPFELEPGEFAHLIDEYVASLPSK